VQSPIDASGIRDQPHAPAADEIEALVEQDIDAEFHGSR
jgi:hypothetical protein